MNIKVIGGVLAVVVVGGGVYANSYLNKEAEENIQKAIVSANENMVNDIGNLDVENIQCSVLFGDQCVLNNVKMTSTETPVEIGKMTVSGVRSLAKAYGDYQGKTLLYADTDVTVKLENITSERRSIGDIWKEEDGESYELLTDDIKQSLADNQLYVEAKVKNDVSKDKLVSDELFSVGLTDLPLSVKVGVKYTYNGDPALLADPDKLLAGKGRLDIFTLMNNFVLNNLSFDLEQGKQMFANIGHNLYVKEQKDCPDTNTMQCYKFAHSMFVEPYKSMDHALSQQEFHDALAKSVADKNSRLYGLASQFTEGAAFTPEEADRILNFMIDGGDSISINFANKQNTPMMGFADVFMTREPKLLRDKLTITVK